MSRTKANIFKRILNHFKKDLNFFFILLIEIYNIRNETIWKEFELTWRYFDHFCIIAKLNSNFNFNFNLNWVEFSITFVLSDHPPPRLGYTRFWQTILYQYYTGQNIYYTILYLYQYYTNFLEWFPGMQWIHSTWEKPFENEKGVKTLSFHIQHKLMFERYAKF